MLAALSFPVSSYASGMSMVPSGNIAFGPGVTIGGDNGEGDSSGAFTGVSWMAGFYFLVSLRAYIETGYSFAYEKGYLSAIGGAGFFSLLLDFGVTHIPGYSQTGGVFGLSIDLPGRNGIGRLYLHWIKFDSARLEDHLRFGLSYNLNFLN